MTIAKGLMMTTTSSAIFNFQWWWQWRQMSLHKKMMASWWFGRHHWWCRPLIRSVPHSQAIQIYLEIVKETTHKIKWSALMHNYFSKCQRKIKSCSLQNIFIIIFWWKPVHQWENKNPIKGQMLKAPPVNPWA